MSSASARLKRRRLRRQIFTRDIKFVPLRYSHVRRLLQPSARKITHGEKKQRETLRGERLVLSREEWVTLFRKRFPQHASLACHLNLPGVIGYSRCNGCRVSGACESHAARCNALRVAHASAVACYDQVASQRCCNM